MMKSAVVLAAVMLLTVSCSIITAFHFPSPSLPSSGIRLCNILRCWVPPPTCLFAAAPSLQDELDSEGLGLCHGILFASGVRSLADMKGLSAAQISNMGTDNFDRREMNRVIAHLNAGDDSSETDASSVHLSTAIDGAFENVGKTRDFSIEIVNKEHNIYKGRLFTEEQCKQIIRMAEYTAYRGTGTIGAGWGNEIYTLTAQHMQCKDVPDFLPWTESIFKDLLLEMDSLFRGKLRKGSTRFESDSEPHLVKYSGRAKGTALHTDNPKDVTITVNVVLSAFADFTGGGTYITALDDTIFLKQGEMLIHLGDLEHAGAEITSGVRHLLIAFLACEWED